MKKTITLCVSGLLLIGSLSANPFTTTTGLNFGINAEQANATKMNSPFAPKKKKGGVWQEGDMIFALGYGFPNIGKSLLASIEDVDNYKATGFGPMHFRFEYALSESFGIGFSSNFNKFGYKYDDQTQTGYDVNGNPTYATYEYDYNWTSVNFLVRFNKHWAAGSKADIFSGTGVGYNYRKISFASTDPNAIEESFTNPLPIGFESTIGVRIFFTDAIAAYIEAGWAKDIIQGGICYKIGQ